MDRPNVVFDPLWLGNGTHDRWVGADRVDGTGNRWDNRLSMVVNNTLWVGGPVNVGVLGLACP